MGVKDVSKQLLLFGEGDFELGILGVALGFQKTKGSRPNLLDIVRLLRIWFHLRYIILIILILFYFIPNIS